VGADPSVHGTGESDHGITSKVLSVRFPSLAHFFATLLEWASVARRPGGPTRAISEGLLLQPVTKIVLGLSRETSRPRID
jgi:hypothetical protein